MHAAVFLEHPGAPPVRLAGAGEVAVGVIRHDAHGGERHGGGGYPALDSETFERRVREFLEEEND